MADQVEAVLDHMVPALRDLLDRGIFSENEIHAIVNRRRESEYLIRRKDCRKADFALYIEAERNLEKLRCLRSKKVVQLLKKKKKNEWNSNNIDTKKSKEATITPLRSISHMADASIIQHLHFLYSRAKRKWKEDLSWHLQHVDFAKSAKSFHLLGKIYAEALQLHPRCIHLWIEAASHEYFGYIVDSHSPGMSGGGSIFNARVLLQRGLRINPTSEDLWLQSFNLELHYIQKLRGRRHILQPGWDTEYKTDQEIKEGKGAHEALYDNLLPLIVYRNALKAIPDVVLFRLRFLDLCAKFSDTESIQQEIRSSIECDCSDSVDAWIAQANYTLHSCTRTQSEDGISDANDVVVDQDSRKRKFEKEPDISCVDWDTIVPKLNQILEQATNKISSDQMYLHAIRFLKGTIKYMPTDINDRLVRAVDCLFIKAKDRGIVSSELILEHANWLMSRGKISDADELFYKTLFIEKLFVTDSLLWIRWAENNGMGLLKSLGNEKIIQKSPEDILQRALELIPMHDKGHFDIASTLFLLQLQTIGPYNKNRTKIQTSTLALFDKLLLFSAQDVCTAADDVTISSRLLTICTSFLKYSITSKDTDFIRGVYNRIFYSSSFLNYYCRIDDEKSIEMVQYLFDASISFEKDLLKEKGIDRIGVRSPQGRRIVDSAVAFFERQRIHKVAKFYKNDLTI